MTSPDVKRYFLEVECVATAGTPSSLTPKENHEEIDGPPSRLSPSEAVRQDFNRLLQHLHVLGRCSFGMVIDNQSFNYQSIVNGPYAVEVRARVLDEVKIVDTNIMGVNLETIVAATYEGVGGLGKRLPTQMITGNWYFMGGGGGPRCYVSQVVRLSDIDKLPTESEIHGRVIERQGAMRSHLLESLEP